MIALDFTGGGVIMKPAVAVTTLIAVLAQGFAVSAQPAPTTSNPQGRPTIVTNPDWAELPNGDELSDAYPIAARVAKVEGASRIECDVEPDGALSHCVVLSETPPGWEFGEAAIEAAAYFRMKPKMVDGRPVAGGKVIIPLNWRLPDPAKPEPAAASLSPPTEADLAAARRIAVITRGAAQVSRIAANLYGSSLSGYASGRSAEERKALNDSWRAATFGLEQAFNEQQAQALAQTFSSKELADIDAFLQSESGRAYLTKSPEAWRRASSDLRPLFKDFIEAWWRSYCAHTTCGETEGKLADRLRTQVEALPAAQK